MEREKMPGCVVKWIVKVRCDYNDTWKNWGFAS